MEPLKRNVNRLNVLPHSKVQSTYLGLEVPQANFSGELIQSSLLSPYFIARSAESLCRGPSRSTRAFLGTSPGYRI